MMQIYRYYMSVPLVTDIDDLTCVFILLQMQMILNDCSFCCICRGSYMNDPFVADVEDITRVLLLLQI